MSHPSDPSNPPLPPDELLARARSILFVCLGNICRSPTAQGIFEHLAAQRGVRHHLRVESCGTGAWHAGELPDPRARAAAARRGVTLASRARVVVPARDFLAPHDGGFDLILPMDHQNRRDLLRLGAPPERVFLFRAFDPTLTHALTPEAIPETPAVPDPYTDAPGGAMFDEVFDMLERASRGLLDRLFPLAVPTNNPGAPAPAPAARRHE
ncbi:MAG TPA: low molecular weight protein-tyrosine-phosphatase [Phycisphaerales bacterium]|nr:low molecular weight protein-tyrosine-phosphatase [Phycisphaerales bacterium]